MLDTLRAFVLVGGVFAGGLFAGAGTVRSAWGSGKDRYDSLDAFARALTTIQRAYVEERTPTDLIHAAIRGMVNDLDPHSIWLSPDEYQKLQDRADGRYFSIGVELLGRSEGVFIERVLPRSPAEIAGLQAGDRLITIDSDAIDGVSLTRIRDRLSGPQGDAVALTVTRAGAPMAFTVVRDEILEVSVDADRFEAGVGYVHIERFSRRTAAEVALAVKSLEDSATLKGLVLDLRDNPGGLITEAVDLVDLFVPDGLIVETRGRDAAPEAYVASTDADDFTMPMVVLINGDSASASELVAGALRDLDRATLIGSASYGKGSMQSIYEFADGSALKLTVARYYLPNGESIAPREGLEPDIRVEMQQTAAEHTAALRASIAGLTIPDAQKQSLLVQLDELPLAAHRAPDPTIPRVGDVDARLADDPQLQAALDHLLR
ncbi:MAG: S41 family peptidase [Myxococcota bacterium]